MTEALSARESRLASACYSVELPSELFSGIRAESNTTVFGDLNL